MTTEMYPQCQLPALHNAAKITLLNLIEAENVDILLDAINYLNHSELRIDDLFIGLTRHGIIDVVVQVSGNISTAPIGRDGDGEVEYASTSVKDEIKIPLPAGVNLKKTAELVCGAMSHIESQAVDSYKDLQSRMDTDTWLLYTLHTHF